MNNVFICIIKPDVRLQIKKVTGMNADMQTYMLADCDENGFQIGLAQSYPLENITVIGPLNESAEENLHNVLH